MENILTPKACEIISVTKESKLEYTFRVKTDIKVKHGQFLQLSIPKVGEAPISVSGFGDGYLDFTIRSVGKVTDEIFKLEAGDTIFLRGSYGIGWPVDKFKDKNIIIVAGGTGVAPVRSMINKFYNEENYVKSLNLVIGFKDEDGILFKNELEKWKEKFNTIYTLDKGEKEGWSQGMVTKHLEKLPLKEFGDNYEVVIVGPPIMMHFTALEFLKLGVKEEKIWVSFERKMSCAVGKCGHCRIDETYVCLEGPVFNYTKAKTLLD
ncbi:MAG: anaerobic sulfite reductase subunit AsrB [Clostridium baratii]|uniref:Sulfite reductase, subunit B n=1 Tax=Clostridium baratii str. Sullivan TaxID=1415775 RepID=A0A0A7FSS9_9CLOT|nr:anaerobic sulfite reductase subunit AsrB [Clostridium baratii]AIY82618.1 sulfite reductase, subunit B [Clostridium baratii str. Sullivan]MBS6007690.1 anaerobic sulfite reductase subunit AsrB [Clostridium baratii]MDU1054482.1 anaerobic sulfite reductase subunit AsrB [Clostridium baratii]MDU4911540.1 anaerobic sulfite reductase subunit AsrB [Clostridium baratii]CUP58948.1 anaerobic sulfite reductase subunit B [Clostridium baratii]